MTVKRALLAGAEVDARRRRWQQRPYEEDDGGGQEEGEGEVMAGGRALAMELRGREETRALSPPLFDGNVEKKLEVFSAATIVPQHESQSRIFVSEKT